MAHSNNRLNESQLSILRLFERKLTNTELIELKDTLVDFLDKQLQRELNKVMAEKKITKKDIPHLGIKDNRTAYLKEIASTKK